MLRYICLSDVVLCSCFIFIFAGCATPPKSNCTPQAIISGAQYQYDENQYVVLTPCQRLEASDLYLKKEREALEQRREVLGLNKLNNDAFGLALSGGGIRSNAFQLGLMSGLHAETYLDKVDYISAVSGGSWAAGAYKASTKDDDQFFKDLNALVGGEDFKDNDENLRPLFNSYQKTLQKMIVDKQSSLLGTRVGFSSQEEWRKMLKTNVLNNTDVLLKDVNKDAKRMRRPYIIFNATHDASFSLLGGVKTKTNFPYEITADFIGTLADCGNAATYCPSEEPDNYKPLGVFSPTSHNDLPPLEEPDNYKSLGVFTSTAHNDLPPLYISHAMAISGAVVPPKVAGVKLRLLDWKIDIPRTGRVAKDTPLRKKVVLTDGGHSENLGALALMERKVPLIIISDAGHNDDLIGELTILQHHAKALLDIELTGVPSAAGIERERLQNELKELRILTYKKDGKSIGTIFYIKPVGYIVDHGCIRDYLAENENTLHLRAYLDTARINSNVEFPTDKTFEMEYEHELILSYYVLGRFFAIRKIVPDLKRAINGDIEGISIRIPQKMI